MLWKKLYSKFKGLSIRKKIEIYLIAWVLIIWWVIYTQLKTWPVLEAVPSYTSESKSSSSRESCFSSRDWRHENVSKAIKNSMNDPDSYEHVETKYSHNWANNIIVTTKVRWKNTFWAKILKEYVFQTDENCNIVSVLSGE